MGLLRKIFKGKQEQLIEPIDISLLGTDVHSHLIPGIDDGAQTMEESIELLGHFEALGYKKVITTPHVMSDYYKNTPEIILSGLSDVKKELEKQGVKIEIEAAAEYNLDADFIKLVEEDNLLTFGDNYVLFELPFFQEPPMLNDTIWKLQTRGYKTILAHVERYSFWFGEWDRILELKDRGVFFQVNINSLTGHYGLEVRKFAERLIDEDLIDLVGSDCHNINHMNLTKRALSFPYLHKVVKKPNLINKLL